MWSICRRGRKPRFSACMVSEKAPEISACEAMMVAAVASTTKRQQRPRRGQHVERVLRRLGVAQHERSLAEVVEQQGRQHIEVPGQADGLGAEMAHVGVERLAARHHQEDRAQHEEAVPAVVGRRSRAIDAG